MLELEALGLDWAHTEVSVQYVDHNLLLARQQLEAARREPGGRSAHTVYGGPGRVLRQTIIALTAGRRLDEHANPGDATVHVLHGRVRLAAADICWEGSAGDLLIVPPVRHTPEALEDSAVLLSLATYR